MNLLDLGGLAYISFSAARGRKRGLADESYRLLRLGTAFGAGCGLHELVHDLISRVLSIAPAYSGPLAFAGTVGGTWMLLRTLKRKLTEWIATRFPDHQAVGGLVAGGLRGLVMTLSVLVTGILAGGGGPVAQSWLARIAAVFVE